MKTYFEMILNFETSSSFFLNVHSLDSISSLHTSLNNAYSGCKPSTSMPPSTHFFQVSLFLSLHVATVISTFLQANTSLTALDERLSEMTTALRGPILNCWGPSDCRGPVAYRGFLAPGAKMGIGAPYPGVSDWQAPKAISLAKRKGVWGGAPAANAYWSIWV